MSSDAKFFAGVVIAAVLVIAGIAIFSKGGSSNTITDIDTTIGHKLGPDTAKVKIVEFGDFQCPACAAAAEAFEQAQKQNAEDVQIIFRHFPISEIHKNAKQASMAAEAAANQNKFWEMYQRLFQAQDSWAGLTDPTNIFVSYAQELGLDEGKFKDDLSSSATKEIVERDNDYGISAGVSQTPTFYINGKKVTGSVTVEQWQQYIDEARANATSG